MTKDPGKEMPRSHRASFCVTDVRMMAFDTLPASLLGGMAGANRDLSCPAMVLGASAHSNVHRQNASKFWETTSCLRPPSASRTKTRSALALLGWDWDGPCWRMFQKESRNS
jgi:hypothetical protein